jgi:hypothetical protein
VARDLGIPESTLRGWKSQEENLKSSLFKVEEEAGLKAKIIKTAKDLSLDQALYDWFVEARSEGLTISGPILKAQAEKFDKQMNGETSQFKASNGWLDRFKNRHGISQVFVCGEIRSADSEAADKYPEVLKGILKEGGYVDEQVYNCDETGLCYKMIPDRTLACKDDVSRREGFKQRKDRVKILFCVNKIGSHKMKPLMIGKSKSPRCFHHVNMSTLPFDYKNSKNAWMTSSIFEDWFHQIFVPSVRSHLKKQKLDQKAILLLDNCPAHPSSDSLISPDGKIKVSYLPKNTTSRIQPLDQGIISVFKQNYRREFIRAVVESSTTLQDFLKTLNLKEVCHLGGKAWDMITMTCIEKCWLKGLRGVFKNEDDTEVSEAPDEEKFNINGLSEEAIVESFLPTAGSSRISSMAQSRQ